MAGAESARVVHEPNVGTGGLWRATAKAMREAGRDPSEATWVGLDLDRLAIACAATNAICWQLGHKVVLGVGDGLDPTTEARAHIQRAHALRLAEGVRADRRMRNVLHTLTQKKEA